MCSFPHHVPNNTSFIPYPLALSSPLVTYITSTQGEDYRISILGMSKAYNFFCGSPIKDIHHKFKKKKNKLWGAPQLTNMSHTTLKSPKKPRPGGFEGHEILEKNKILSIYLMPMVKVIGPTAATWSPHMQLIFHVPITTFKELKIWRNPVCEKHSTQHHHVLVAIGYSYSRVSLCVVCVYVCMCVWCVCLYVYTYVCKCFQLFEISGVFTSEFFVLNC